jgi:alpha-1,3-rhamnosyl/mannosyltransferase
VKVLLDLSVLATATTSRGIGRYVSDLALELCRLVEGREDVQLLGVEALPWVGRARLSDDVRASVERLVALPRRQAHAAWAYQVRLSLPSAVKRAAPDVLHSGHPNATPMGRVSCPRIVTCHDLIPLAYPEHHTDWRDGGARGRLHLDKRRFHRADHVIAISHATADDLMMRLDVPRSRISVVHNGVDLSRWKPEPRPDDDAVRVAHGLNGPYLLCVGAANWRKNSEGVMQGLARARRQIGKSELVVAWAARLGSEDRDRVLSAARAAGVADAVKLLGYVSDQDLAALYRGATAQVFVSRAEGFGYPVIEAMASGCPVITSNRSSLIEIAEGAAITVDPEDADAIADAIVLLADDNAERRRLSARGIERAARFSLRRMAEQTLDVYAAVAKR